MNHVARNKRRPALALSLLMVFALLAGCATSTKPVKQAKPDPYPPAPPVPEDSEVVLQTGEQVVASTPTGKIKITAGPGLRRTFSWDGTTRTVVMKPRKKRFAGSKGIYYEGIAPHWKPYNGIDRARVEEGQRFFENLDDAQIWMQIRRLHYIHTSDGLVVGWRRLRNESTLQVELWQFNIGKNGKTTYMPGAKDFLITRRQAPLQTSGR